MKNKNEFLQDFGLNTYMEKAEKVGMTWNRFEEIYDDYLKRFENYRIVASKMVNKLYEDVPKEIKIIYGRAKNPDHLIEKLIRKVGKEAKAKYGNIGIHNYRTIVTDLVGIRILTLQKEDWLLVHDHIHAKFEKELQPPVAYVCYGDREIFDASRISVDYTNKGYRSQHYIVEYNGIPCEIQVRTLAEEVYGEFDHKVRYPYKTDNKFLSRYNRIVAKATSELDDLISTATHLSGKELNILDKAFEADSYIDWKKQVRMAEGAETHKTTKHHDFDVGEKAVDFSRKCLMDRED